MVYRFSCNMEKLAKLLLNTLWGKFGEKTKRTVTVSLDDPAKFWSLITDNGIEVTRFHMVHDDLEREKPVLGQLASEIEEGDHIVEFVCAGPKAYAYRTQRGTVECKVKGFHMNFTTSKRVHLEAMLELVQDEDEEKEVSGIEVFSIESHSPSAPGLTTFKDRRKKNTKTKRTPFKLEKMEYDMGPMEITVELEDFQK
ncbi:hypothetical protein QZH41_002153, partial [Actinostola sp. cb2023]